MPEEQIPNLKRKRYEPKQKDTQTKLRGKLHHVSKEVRKAVKKAKTFETQRMVKRLKAARNDASNEADIKTLESQLEMLKQFSHDRIACTALQTKIHKDRVLSTFITEDDVLALFPSLPTTPTEAKLVESRLLSSKTLAEEVNRTMLELRATVAQPAEVTTGDTMELEDEPRAQKRAKNSPKPLEPKKTSSLIISDENSEEGSEEGFGGIGSRSDSEDDESVDEDSWESGTVDGSENEARDNGEAAAPLPKAKPKSLSVPATASTFLPSLAVGYIRGSDESDFSDSEAKVIDSSRKNRRGQRARRAIWEKKYGRNAKHVKKEVQEQKKNQQTRETRLAHMSNKKKPPAKRPTIQELAERPKDSGWSRPAQKLGTQSSTVEPKLHPSWEAKKREKEKQSAGIVPFQGKKIMF